jgi:hypothetical protein
MKSEDLRRPVVAVFVAPKITRVLSRQEEQYDCLQYALAARAANVPLYVFQAADMDLETGTVKGWTLDPDGQWQYGNVPWPDFVYDLAKGEAGKRERAMQINADPRIKRLNEVKTFGKWPTHRALVGDFPHLLPDTVLGRTAADLELMLTRHAAVLTKPSGGTWGLGISKIWREADGSYTLQASHNDEQETGLSLADAFARAKEVAGGRRMVIQQAIDLLKTDGEVMDLRLMMGKDSQGMWQVLQWYIRIGRSGAFVTNWHSGGSYVDVLPGLVSAGVAPEQAAALFHQARQVAQQVAAKLEQAQTGRMVEVGLNFAFDRNLRLWMIEANGWPSKGEVIHEQDPIPRIYSCVIDYALSLWDR